MADIFLSYTSSDRDWAFWIGQELANLGHRPHVHEWEVSGGADIAAWMEDNHREADHVLCVMSEAYLNAPYSGWERRATQWASSTKRSNLVLPIFVEPCEAPTLLAPFKRCDLYGLTEEQARERLAAFLGPASRPSGPTPFPGAKHKVLSQAHATAMFPREISTISNISIAVPRHFLGRSEDLAAIHTALARNNGRIVISAVHGLRGVGKTTLAAAYAERHRNTYRATWWIRGEAESTMRSDLAGLGVRLGWILPEEKEEPAFATTMERLRHEGEGILLIYDDAKNADEIRKYLPRGGAAQIIVTSNEPNWRGVAAPVEIESWPIEIGADYLVARTGRIAERVGALALSEALGGLPLALEQAAAYCERLEVSFVTYLERYGEASGNMFNTTRDGPRAHQDPLSVAKAFSLAIHEAAKLHPAAEPLIVYAALLAPEPIPLFLFSEAQEQFGQPLSLALAEGGLDEIVAALRAFALIDRESIADERDPTITTDSIRLHPLVRRLAAARREGNELEKERRALIEAMAAVYPKRVFDDSKTWPRARRLDALALALVDDERALSPSTEQSVSYLLDQLASYRMGPLAASAQARPLLERALAIDEKIFGPDHPGTAATYNNLAYLLHSEGKSADARPYYERALSINEMALGPDHATTGRSLSNLGSLLLSQGDFIGAQPYFERALAINEKTFGGDHPNTANSLNNLGNLLQERGDSAKARLYFERALAIREKVLGFEHPDTAVSLSNLGGLLRAEGDLAGAEPYLERSLAIFEKSLGPAHPWTQTLANSTAETLGELGRTKEANALRQKFGIKS